MVLLKKNIEVCQSAPNFGSGWSGQFGPIFPFISMIEAIR